MGIELDYPLIDSDVVEAIDTTLGDVIYNLPVTTNGAYVIVKIDSSINKVIITPLGGNTIMNDINMWLEGQWASARLLLKDTDWVLG